LKEKPIKQGKPIKIKIQKQQKIFGHLWEKKVVRKQKNGKKAFYINKVKNAYSKVLNIKQHINIHQYKVTNHHIQKPGD